MTPTGRAEDLTLRRYGRLVAVERAPDRVERDGSRKRRWLCACACGARVVVLATNLKRGRHRSCGCLRRELMRRLHAMAREEAST